LINYLNNLAASAHTIIYLPPRTGFVKHTAHFLKEGFPRAVARTWRFHAASALLFFGGGLLAYMAVLNDINAAYALMPAGEFRMPGATRETLEKVLRYGKDESGGTKFAFASFLFGHNLKVGLLSMAAGILAAVPTVFLMAYNGMIIGAFTAVHHMSGIHAEYWAWILPHGVSELTAIILCGGAGLKMGKSILHPGLQTRRQSVIDSGRETLLIAAGVACMLIIAAIAESYLRQSHLSTAGRLVFAGVMFVFFAFYFAYGAVREFGARGTKK
jgi:uncharacterized membrane protein SpoIIM required for sporulation